jgi:hypothetical protein
MHPPMVRLLRLVRSGHKAAALPRGFFRANGYPAVRPPTKLSKHERTKAIWPPSKTGADFCLMTDFLPKSWGPHPCRSLIAARVG